MILFVVTTERRRGLTGWLGVMGVDRWMKRRTLLIVAGRYSSDQRLSKVAVVRYNDARPFDLHTLI